jgi:UbiD family decarboxylase
MPLSNLSEFVDLLEKRQQLIRVGQRVSAELKIVETESFSLDCLPIPMCRSNDVGRFINLSQMITRNPQTGMRNVGMFRLQVVDERTLIRMVLPEVRMESYSISPFPAVSIPARLPNGDPLAAHTCLSKRETVFLPGL